MLPVFFPVTDLPHMSPRVVPASPAPAPPPLSAPQCPSPPGAASTPRAGPVPSPRWPLRPCPRWRRRAYFPTSSPCVRPCPPGAMHVAHPHPSRHCPLFGMPVPFRPLGAPVPLHVHTAAIPSSHALPPSSCPPPPLLASTHPPSCRHTLVLSTDGVGMNHTAVREHHIDLKALDRIIAPGDACRINAAALEAQRRPNPALQPVRGATPAPDNLLERAARPLHPRVQVDTPDLLRAALPPADPAALAPVPRGGRARALWAWQRAQFGVSQRLCHRLPSEDADFVPYAALLSCFYLPKTTVYVVAWAVEVLANVGRASGLLNRRAITYFGRLELSLALDGHAEAAEWEEAKDPAYRLPWAVCSASPSMSRCRGPRRRTSLFRLHDPHHGGLSWGFQTTRWAWALGVDSGVRPPCSPATRYPTPTLFRTRRILQHIFYFFIVCPPIPTLDEHFWIDVQAPTGVSPISPCATQGDFFKEPSPITPHSIPPYPKPCAVKPNSSFEAPSPNPPHLGQGSRMDIQALAPVPPISPWRCHGEFRSLRTLDHPSPPLPRDPSWTFGCWPPCRPFHAYAPKPKFVFFKPRPSPTHPTFSQRFRPDVRAPAADFAVAQRGRFLSLRTFAHLNPPFAQGFGSTSARWTPPHQIHPAKAEIIFQDHCPP
ncbi:hypothetical protein B0H14DRAFT_3729102 [Mycena olivaceomarginata]|nr:hypothetical protein B0H14DRAFT_3729102 [Mycena olivaceomarginata]